MENTELKNKTEELRQIILKEGIVYGSSKKIVITSGAEGAWIFDLRNIFLKTRPINLIVDIFWHHFDKEFPFQVGGQEIASIPLTSAIVASNFKGRSLNGFIIRKSRKPEGLQKIIEGTINEEKIVLVDDLINSASTIKKQLQVLENEGRLVYALFTIVKFRDDDFYKFLEERNIKVISTFNLKDFNLEISKSEFPIKQRFTKVWQYQNPNPNYYFRVPKSSPAIDSENVYMGTDNAEFIAVNQRTGELVWKFFVQKNSAGKSIFSNPVIFGNSLFFGAYDGNFYCLDKNNGKVIWTFEEAEWVGSSAAPAPDLGLVFVGLEFGLFKKKGGIVALDIKTGEKRWEFIMPEYVHSTPLYIKEKRTVIIGSNNNLVYSFDAKTGKLKWTYEASGPVKESFAYYSPKNLVVFGCFDKNFYALDISTGEKVGSFGAENIFFSTPAISGDNAVIGSCDKGLYNFNLKTGELDWVTRLNGRIFADPLIINDKVYIGTTDGRFYELDIKTGKILDWFQTLERITNKAAYNEETERFFVSTYANEIYCLEKIK